MARAATEHQAAHSRELREPIATARPPGARRCRTGEDHDPPGALVERRNAQRRPTGGDNRGQVLPTPAHDPEHRGRRRNAVQEPVRNQGRRCGEDTRATGRHHRPDLRDRRRDRTALSRSRAHGCLHGPSPRRATCAYSRAHGFAALTTEGRRAVPRPRQRHTAALPAQVGRRAANDRHPAILKPELEAHLATFAAPGKGLVFCGTLDQPFRIATLHAAWKRAIEAVGIEGFKFHDLRHTGNTLAASTGASTKELMARMGHASPRAALIYQHATEDRDQEIADALSALVGAKRSNRPKGAAVPTST